MEQTVKGYEIIERIGSGGFGAVYRATQPLLKRDVAIKIIHAEYANNPEYIRRFEAEAQMVASLDHLHIIPLYDYWRDPTGAYLVMRYLRGGSLRQKLSKGPMKLDDVRVILEQVGAALTVAHRHDVIHRDMKPDNIMLDEEGNGYLGDFGIAKDLAAPSVSQDNMVVGTPDYMAPEQIQGDTITGQTDIYSLGIVLYELLAGVKPFDAPTLTALMYAHLNDPVPSITEKLADAHLPEEIDAVIQKATAKNPADRYADAMQMAIDFREKTSDTPSISLPSAEDLGYDTGDNVPTSQIDIRMIQEQISVTPGVINPYKGLEAFEQSDAKHFFGRSNLIEVLLNRMDDDADGERFLGVVGPSGSGKSSVVKAGVIPAVRRGQLPESEDWYVVEIEPRTHPLEQLETALLRVAVNPPPELLTQLRADTRGLTRAVNRILPADNSELLLVIDQFEEVFTLVDDEAERTHFLNSLVAAVTEEDSRLRVVVTMRADFFDKPLLYPEFGALFRHRYEVVMPLNDEELREAIIEPANTVGLALEAGLVEALISDVAGQPSALPLLQFALTELYDNREKNMLTLDAYRDIGRATGALARRAEQTYAELDSAAQKAARQLFLRLVVLGEGTEDTRRRVPQSEVADLSMDDEAMDRAIDAFGTRRLLAFDIDPNTRLPAIEIAHEALIRTWTRLWGWLDSNRSDLRLQRSLMAKAEEWRNRGRDSDVLLRGAILEDFEEWADKPDLDVVLTRDEREILEASIEEREKQEAEEKQRQEHERELDQRARNRLRILVAVMAVGIVIAGILSVIAASQSQRAIQNESTAVAAGNQAATNAAEAEIQAIEAATNAAEAEAAGQEAETQAAIAAENEADALAAGTEAAEQANLAATNAANAQTQAAIAAENEADALEAGQVAATQAAIAEENAREAQNMGLVGEAQFAASRQQPDLALALALEAYSRDPGTISREVFDAVSNTWIQDRLNLHDDWIWDIAVTDDGARGITASRDSTLVLWDMATGAELCRLGSEEGIGHTAAVRTVDFTPDGSFAVSGSDDGTVWLWWVDPNGAFFCNGEMVDMEPSAPILDIAFHPSGTQAIWGTSDGSIIHWDFASASLVNTYNGHTGAVQTLAFHPNNPEVFVSGSADNTLIVWDTTDADTPILDVLHGHSGSVLDIDFSPDGMQLVSSSADSSLLIWDINPDSPMFGEPLHLMIDSSVSVNAVAFSPTGDRIISGDDGGIVLEWDATSGELLRRFEGHAFTVTGVAYAPDGQSAFTSSFDRSVIQWDLRTPGRITILEGHIGTVNDIVFTPDGLHAVSASSDGTLILWDVVDSRILNTLQPNDPETSTPLNVPLLSVAVDEAGLQGLAGTATGSLVHFGINLEDESLTQLNVYANVHNSAINDIEFSSFGDSEVAYAASASDDNNVIAWELQAGTNRNIFEMPHDQIVWSLAFNGDGSRLVTSSFNGTLRLWDFTQGGAEIGVLLGHEQSVQSVAYSADGRRIVSGAADGTIFLWDAESGERLLTFEGHTDSVNSIAFSTDESFVLSGSSDNDLILWQWSDEAVEPLRRFQGHTGEVQTVAFSPDPSLPIALSGGTDGRIIMWEASPYPGGIIAWAEANRHVPEISDCDQRALYSIAPPCDTAGVFPTRTPMPEVTIVEQTPFSMASIEVTEESGILNQAVSEELALIGIDSANGSLIETVDNLSINLENTGDTEGIYWVGGTHENFVVRTSIVWGQGFEDDACGIRLRLDDEDDYNDLLLERANGGRMLMRSLVDGTLRREELGYSPGLSVATSNATGSSDNALIIVVSGDTYSVYLNGEYIYQFRNTYHEAGRIALVAQGVLSEGESVSAAGERFTCRFADTWLWELEEPVVKEPPPAPVEITERLLDPEREGGELVDRIPQQRVQVVSSSSSLEWQDFDGRYIDFVAGTTFQWGELAADSCGMVMRKTDDENYYAVRVNQDGRVGFYVTVNGVEDELGVARGVDLNDGDLANQDYELVVVGVDNSFSIYVNDVYVAQFQDEENRHRRGEIALMASNESNREQTWCDFSDAWIWEMTDPSIIVRPSPTPPPEQETEDFVLERLGAIGIPTDSGTQAEAFDISEEDPLRIDMTGEDWLYSWESFSGEYKNFVVSIKFAWGPGADEDQCGVRFRAEDRENFYVVDVNQNRRLRLSTQENNEWDESRYGNGGALTLGYSESDPVYNTLTVVVIENTFTVYINDQYDTQFEDDRFETGTVSFLAGTDDDSDESWCDFAEAWVWEFENIIEIPPTPNASPTPIFTVGEFPYVEQGLQTVGIPLDSGSISETKDEVRIDLTEDDNLVRKSLFNFDYTDFVMGATFTWGPGATNDTCGFYFRENGDTDSTYLIEASREGAVAFWERIDGEWGDSPVDGDASLLDIREGADNEMILVGVGDTFMVYINGEYAGDFQDDELTEGRLALIGTTFEDSEETWCDFRDAWVWELTGDVDISVADESGESEDTPDYVLDALEMVGVDPTTGELAEQISTSRIDLSELDNTITSGDIFNGEYVNLIAGTTINWGPGSTEDACGLMFRRVDNNNYYSVLIDREDEVFMVSFKDGELQPTDYVDISTINTDEDDSNEMVIVVSDDTFTVFINGEFAAQFEDEELTSGAVTGAALTYDESDEAWCDFSDSWLWDLGKESIDVATPK